MTPQQALDNARQISVNSSDPQKFIKSSALGLLFGGGFAYLTKRSVLLWSAIGAMAFGVVSGFIKDE